MNDNFKIYGLKGSEVNNGSLVVATEYVHVSKVNEDGIKLQTINL